jgi:hypothetical protein
MWLLAHFKCCSAVNLLSRREKNIVSSAAVQRWACDWPPLSDAAQMGLLPLGLGHILVGDKVSSNSWFLCLVFFSDSHFLPSPTPGPSTCLPNYFRCSSGACVMDTWVCDGYRDCADGSDEEACPSTGEPLLAPWQLLLWRDILGCTLYTETSSTAASITGP